MLFARPEELLLASSNGAVWVSAIKWIWTVFLILLALVPSLRRLGLKVNLKRPPRAVEGGGERMGSRGRSLIFGSVVVLVLLILAVWLNSLFFNELWFRSLGAGISFRVNALDRIYFVWGAIIIGAGLFLLLAGASPRSLTGRRKLDLLAGAGFGVLVGWLVAGTTGYGAWLYWLYRQPWGMRDPVFGLDYSFYFAEVPLVFAVLRFYLFVLLYDALVKLVTAEREIAGSTLLLDGPVANALGGGAGELAIAAKLWRVADAFLPALVGDGFLAAAAGGYGGFLKYEDVHIYLPLYLVIGVVFLGASVLNLVRGWRPAKAAPGPGNVLLMDGRKADTISFGSTRGLLPRALLSAAVLFVGTVLAGPRPLYLLVLVLLFLVFKLQTAKGQAGFTVAFLAGSLLALVAAAVEVAYVVTPNELSYSASYLTRDLETTRSLLGLSGVRSTTVQTGTVTAQSLANNPQLLANVRLVDHRTLEQSLPQLQGLRSYYTFPDITVDRYKLHGQESETMLAVRDLDPSQLPTNSQTQVNLNLVYTHGYGAAAVRVSDFDQNGNPNFILHDMPPVATDPALSLRQPQIYFSPDASGPVFVDSNQPEFDYPSQTGDRFSSYRGPTGIPMSGLNRLRYALYSLDPFSLFSRYISPRTRLLLNRNSYGIMNSLLPQLSYDNYTQWVVYNGHLYGMVSAYDWASGLPFAQDFTFTQTNSVDYGQASDFDTDFIRSNVKVLFDAATGQYQYYYLRTDDPIVNTLRRVYPGLMKPISALPAGLRAHLEYPESLFDLQYRAYETYHTDSYVKLYNLSDVWGTPNELYSNSGSQGPMPAYYTLASPTGAGRTQFVLLRPYTPSRRNNLIGLLTVGNDPGNYGKLTLAVFSSTQEVTGPSQEESYISQNPTISQDLSLWDQGGSQVIRGNLILNLVDGAILYTEPIYITAASGSLPELKRVIAASGTQVAMGDSLTSALASLVGVAPPSPTPTPTPTTRRTISSALKAQYQRVVADFKAGDFTGFGDDLAKLGQLIGGGAGS